MSIIISFAALIISAITLYSNWKDKKFDINVTTVASYSTGGDGFYVRIILENNSSQPITLLNANIDKYKAQRTKNVVRSKTRGNDLPLSTELPLTFMAYEGKEFNLFFPASYDERQSYKDSKNFELRTTRGIHNLEIDLYNSNQNIANLFKLEEKRY
ncbi:hypothetical protein ACE3LZ_03030 [Staphylococcus saprophyticus]|uniref:hypothetical protein n=1 Tax=Staphylococcus TaxID=1279 RepID=UPI0009905961|nr:MULTISPECIES: hypothetical protein [Staphylococcus]MBF2751538.1 hypothetical protein [Staphylococcus saprophyticus]MDW3827231.1 hypothetical protein [Staphylococcus saprophyticus]MDW3894464.1 hypothetical protein [Staphylococcus saprophyticus]OOO71640.1 hypothetical protein B0W56_06800 [Staphylococcus saprophyticus]